MQTLSIWVVLGVMVVLGSGAQAQAGVFTTPRFVEPGKWSLGVEPELTLTHGAGLAGNLRYTHGLTDLNNVTAIIGTGDGPRRFRLGGNVTFDFFPDIEGQPGIGVAAQGLYVRKPTYGQFELTAIPYVHKTFISDSNELEPFVSFPIGMGFRSGKYDTLMQLVVGSMFKLNADFRYSLELGIDINKTETYLSGGIAYYF